MNLILQSGPATIELKPAWGSDGYNNVTGYFDFDIVKCRGFQDASIAEKHRLRTHSGKWLAPRSLRGLHDSIYAAVKEIVDLY